MGIEFEFVALRFQAVPIAAGARSVVLFANLDATEKHGAAPALDSAGNKGRAGASAGGVRQGIVEAAKVNHVPARPGRGAVAMQQGDGVDEGAGGMEGTAGAETSRVVSGIYQWDGTGTSVGFLRELHHVRGDAEAVGLWAQGQRVNVELASEEVSVLSSLAGGVLTRLGSSFSSVSTWWQRAMIDFVYKYLQFHVLFQDNAESLRPESCTLHVRIKMPRPFGGYHTQWRRIHRWDLNGRTPVFNTRVDMSSICVLHQGAEAAGGAGGQGEAERSIQFLAFSVPNCHDMRDVSPASIPRAGAR